MDNEQHIKTLQTDARGKNRLKYVSTKERAKIATADVYRSYHRSGIGVTSAASREERLHNPVLEGSQRSQKRQRVIKADDGGRVAVVSKERNEEILSDDDDDDDDDSAAACESSNFASELDIANDRNGSGIFGNFYQHVWPLVRSLPELLHHAPQVVEALVSYLLSPASNPGERSLMDDEEREKKERYIVNHATTDMLHMMGALARDLRHEIHPFLHKDILPRIFHDLLNPPIDPSVQQQPLNVTVVEAAFRTLSYIFRYDAEKIISQVDKPGHEPCLEQMRQYYGVTLAHRREVVRRLAAESFAPLVRKIKTDAARSRHLRRILRALAVSSVSEASGSNDVRMKRTQDDAVDGISQLFFQVARGITGRMHSKGRLVVESLLDAFTKDFPEKDIIFDVASSFFQRLSYHLDAEEFTLVVDDLLVGTKKQLPSKAEIQKHTALSNCVKLIVEVLSFRDGEQLRDIASVHSNGGNVATSIVQILKSLCHDLTFPFLTPPTRRHTLMLLCTTWKALKGSPTLQSTLESLLPGLLKHDALSGIDGKLGQEQASQNSPIRILLEELLPHLPRDVAMGSLGSATLVAAASISNVDPWDAMSLVHALATTNIVTEEEDDVDTLLYVENASSCNITSSEKEALLNTALLNIELEDFTAEMIHRIGVFARCAVFVTAVSTESGDQTLQAQYKRVTKWLFKMLNILDGAQSSDKREHVVVKAFLVESVALLAKEMSARLRHHDLVEKTISQAKAIAETMLLSNPESMWAVKSAAAVVDACQETRTAFSENRDALFEKLVPNLRKESHFLRLHTLQILASFGTRSYVTDHAELDLTDDLDEDKSTYANQTNDRGSAVVAGACDVIDTLLSLEATPVNLVNERRILSLISRVEVLARCGRLPVDFTEAAANHMLGLFHVKFAAIWPVATTALASIAESNTDLLWPSLHAMMTAAMELPPTKSDQSAQIDNGFVLNPTSFFEKCLSWETSGGCDSSLFLEDIQAAQNVGRVSRHQHTDPSTRFELVWRVLEEADCVMLKKSRTIVPVFFEFLRDQYFLFFDDDPNAREIRLDPPEMAQPSRWKREDLSRNIIQIRLLSMLKAFAVIKGPRQLYKSETLKAIFTAFLTHSDFNVAQLSLNCLIKYKLTYITPYVDHLRAMFKRFELRETLLKFETSGGADQENRKRLMPLLSRILFGRLSARAQGNKSSRDSPAGRRTAVLAFLSRQCEEDADMYPFIYLMVRQFIPRTCVMKPIEDQDVNDRIHVDRLLQSLNGVDLICLTPQVFEGFLHLLESVVSQLGQRLKSFVPQLMSIVMAIANLVQQQFNSEGEKLLTSSSSQPTNTLQYDANNRAGAIRTLCFRRLSDIYSQFSSTVDLSPFTASLWSFSRGSVKILPQVVVNSDKVPSLMHLLRTLSSHPRLVPLLISNNEAVEAIVLCISNTSSDAVMDAALTIIENLLADCKDLMDPKANGTGTELGWVSIRNNLPLLLRQFASRLRGSHDTQISPVSSGKPRAFASSMWRRELGVLCRISDVALQGHVTPGESDNDSLETLCDLLIPFLGKRGAGSEVDQMNVLGILQSCWSKIGKECALSHYESLSRLLGPSNGHPGISSLQVRSAIAAAVQAVADRLGSVVARRASRVLVQLCSVNRKRVDEMDYESVIPAINGLIDASNECSWLSYLRANDCSNNVARTIEVESLLALSPLLNCCCHQMFDTDGVVSRGSFKAVKTLVGLLCHAEKSENGQGIENSAELTSDPSRKFLEGTIIPLIRQGLNARNVTVRKYFVLILSDVARGCRFCQSPNLYGDLNALTNDDDQDLDFFLNITHVQIHRRARAFQRLRKLLNQDCDDKAKAIFTLQSLSNVLLPLAMHPIYECRTKAEESFALEAIETAGAIARHLSWSKYHSALWTPLSMFDRHPEQERYLIGVICAIIDGFHFDVSSPQEVGDEGTDVGKNSVLRALEKRVIPRIEGLMTKEKSNRDGTKTKTLRSTVVLALFKLFKKFPKHFFEARLARLLAIICGALRDKDSDARDVARNALVKITSDIDISYLGDIIRELAVSLTEGYQLHVRSATLHGMLLGLSKCYKPDTTTLVTSPQVNTLDYCVPAIMDLIQQDLFGEARERREAEGAKVRYVKEASGSKSLDSIEVVGSLVCFQPSVPIFSNGKTLSQSSIHAIVSPLLERLRSPDVESSAIRQIGQCLQRVVSGISRNPSVTREVLLPFIYATIEPFIGDQKANTIRLDYEGDDVEETLKPLSVTRNNSLFAKVHSPNVLVPGAVAVVEWRPSALQTSNDSCDAQQRKRKEARDLRLVQDGANAPKLTGSSRHSNRRGAHQVQTLNLPANVQAVLFGLNLLQSALKRFKRLEDNRVVSMLDPFVSLLTTCACCCRDTDIVLVSLRCLILMFPMNLPSIIACARSLGTKTLDILGSSGGTSQVQSEMAQASFKLMTLLTKLDNIGNSSDTVGSIIADENAVVSGVVPLDSEQMVVLVSIVQGAVAESGQQNQALGLISALVSRRFISPEFYDLLEKVLELSVRSHTASVRLQASNVFTQYLLNYPMEKHRVEQHFKQVLLNTKYEHEAGRLSAIGLATALVEKLPTAVLGEYAQLFFLPLVLQLVNDDSKDCREAIARCLSRLLKRVPLDVVRSIYEYVVKWSNGTESLQRTALQLFGLFVEAREDFMARPDVAQQLLDRLRDVLDDDKSAASWEIAYFTLSCLEKLSASSSTLVSQQTDLLVSVVSHLKHSHPWIKQASTRVMSSLFPLTQAVGDESFTLPDFVISRPGTLFEMARNLCTQIEADEIEHDEEISTALTIKTLVRVLQAMHYGHELSLPCLPCEVETKDPIRWVLTRLSQSAKPKRPKVRAVVFRFFAAFTVYCSPLIIPLLDLILEPLHRSISEASNELENPDTLHNKASNVENSPLSVESALASEVLQLLEDKLDGDVFLNAYAVVKTRAKEKKEQRKILAKSEAARNPEFAAKRKTVKHDREKRRRKRKNEEQRRQRGGQKRTRVA